MFPNNSAALIYQNGEHFYNPSSYSDKSFQDPQCHPGLYQYSESPILSDISNLKTSSLPIYNYLNSMQNNCCNNTVSEETHLPKTEAYPEKYAVQPDEIGNRRKRKLIQIEEDSVCSFESDESCGERKRKRKSEVSKEQRMITNKRERKRTVNLNEAFACLRNLIPTLPSDKTSKIQTLKLASRYIEFLQCTLLKSEPGETGNQIQDEGISKDKISYDFSMWRLNS